ncbi:MAG: kelch repeat-containing protein [Candidatus Bathyarchaeota archaeon]|nr:kelch repeat-containing protein [Candidatus Bathyarchaeota archaeon]MDI9577676.1 kelch repeat-containing protein [Thermoproteota archaeon]
MNKSTLLLIFIFIVISLMIIIRPVVAIGDSWCSKSSMPSGGAVYGATVIDEEIYAFGAYGYDGITHYTAEKYDPKTDTWSTIAQMPTPRIEFATAVYENKIYIIGGKISRGDASLNTVEVYDPTTNSWTSVSSIPTARDSMQANTVNGKIYVISGKISLTHAQSVAVFSDKNEVYDPQTDTWASVTSIPNHVAGYVSAVLDNKIYVIGGSTEEPPIGWYAVNTTQIYDPATDAWTFGADIPETVEGAVGCATTGSMAPKRIYVFAGHDENGHRDLNQVYDPIIDEWITAVKQNFYGYGELATTVIDDLIYAIGGSYSELVSSNPWGYTVNPDPVYCPNPPFPAVNYRYTPIGYGASEFISPNITLLSPMNKDYSLGNVSITYTVDESTSWAGYRLDEQKLVTITGNTTLIGLASGIHNITLYARDTSGNSGISETGMFSVDKPEPFPAGLFVVAVVVIIVCAGLLVYLKKNKRAP